MLTSVALCIALAAGLAPELAGVRYVANAGVMVTLDGHKILIDAPIRDGITPYPTSSSAERGKLEGATAPYDSVAAILVTHWHEDHFSPEAIAEHLRHNPRAVLVSSQEVVGRVRAIAGELGPDRFAGVTPAPGQSRAVSVGGLTVHVLRARHNATRRWPEEHVAFLIEGSQTVLHTGDAELTPGNFVMLGGLPRIDVAIVPFWHLLNDTTRTQTIESIMRPRTIVGMHLPQADAGSVQKQLDEKKVAATLLVTPATDLPVPSKR